MKTTVVKSFALKQELLDKLKVIAECESRTVNNLVAKVLSEYVAKVEVKK